jgi:hypothetical protein
MPGVVHAPQHAVSEAEAALIAQALLPGRSWNRRERRRFLPRPRRQQMERSMNVLIGILVFGLLIALTLTGYWRSEAAAKARDRGDFGHGSKLAMVAGDRERADSPTSPNPGGGPAERRTLAN